MRLALTLGGTDFGRSGIGVYTRAIIPRLQSLLQRTGDELILIGTSKELHAYRDVLDGAHCIVLPATFNAPGFNALFHFFAAGSSGARANASVLLLPAANRRMPIYSSIPTIAVVHDIAQLHVPAKYDAWRMAYFRYAAFPAIRRASRIVAVSEFTRNDLAQAFSLPHSWIDLVRNGVDAAKFSAAASNEMQVRRVRQSLGLDSPYILYLSRLEHPGKNHLRLIEAFAKSPIAARHSLVFAGADWGALQRIKETSKRFQLGSRVRLLGFIPDEMVPSLLAGADSVAMVGLHEGFGLPALEALAAGRPVFVSNTGALKEVTGDLAATCEPFDCHSIRMALEKTISDADFQNRSKMEGPAFAQQHSWDVTAESLLSICRSADRRVNC